MPKGTRSGNLVDKWVTSLKCHPLVAAVLLVVTLVTGMAGFTNSLDTLSKFFRGDDDANEAVDLRDAHFEQKIVGTWKALSNLPVPSGFTVTDFRYTYLKGGLASWRGTYVFQGMEFPIIMSGKWNVRDGILYLVVESSNIPLAVREGFSTALRLVRITDTAITYVDLADGQMKVDHRVK